MTATQDLSTARPGPSVTPPGTLRTVGLVAGRELKLRFRSRVFRIMTPLFVVILVGGIFIDARFIQSHTVTQTVGFLAADQQLATEVVTAAKVAGTVIHPVTIADAADGTARVRDGSLDLAIVGTSATGFDVVTRDGLDDLPRSVLSALAQQHALDDQITALGGDRAAVEAALASAGVREQVLDPPDPRATSRIALGLITGILIYLALVIFGPAVAQGVVEEKSSRVVELLLGTIRPWQLMAGKVIGIGVVGLSQLVVYAAVGLPLADRTDVLHLPLSSATGSALWGLLWFVLGFLLYALLFAAAGALVSRQEEVAGVTAPLVMILVIPYAVGISVLPTNPDSQLLVVLAIIPLTAPLVMPMLIAVQTVSDWQIALSLVLTVLTVAALVRVTGRIYAGAIRRSGARVSIRDALRR